MRALEPGRMPALRVVVRAVMPVTPAGTAAEMDFAKPGERAPAAVIVTVATQYDKSLTANEQRSAADVDKSKVFWEYGTVIALLSTATNDDLNGACHWGYCHLLFSVAHLSSATLCTWSPVFVLPRTCIHARANPWRVDLMGCLA